MASMTKQFLDQASRRAQRANNNSGLVLRSLVSCLLVSVLLLQSLSVTSANTNGTIAPVKTVAPPNSSRSNSAPSLPPDETIVVYGPHRFDRTGLLTKAADQFTLPADTFAPFAIQVQNGDASGAGRVLIGTVRLNGSVVFSSTELNLQVPSLTRPVTLAAQNTLEVTFFSKRASFLTITLTGTKRTNPLAPVISDFNPKRGIVGTPVTLSGTNLITTTDRPTVTFTGSNGTRVPASVTSATETRVLTTVPNGAVTGPIELTTTGGTARTSGPFTVDTAQDFQVIVSPASTSAVQRSTSIQVISVTSAQANFSQLARLTATGLPDGVRATFDPPQITAGGTSTLSVSLANVDLAPGSYSFNVSGTADVDGHELVHTAPATINVIAAGKTTLAGRVLSTDNEPIMGAVASLDGKSALTDSSGSFLLSDVTAGKDRPVMIQGSKANAPNRTYPDINEAATVIAGQANVVPFNFYLPPIDISSQVEVKLNEDTVAKTPRLTDYQLVLPMGANLHMPDGTPVSHMSVTPLPIDRIPAPLPADVMTAEVYTAQPGNARTNNDPVTNLPIQIPVTYPNDMHADPGTSCKLWVFDHDNVHWRVYGTGTVSADGRTIVPDTNPSTGKPFGLDSFAWHFVSPPPPATATDSNPGDDCPPCPCRTCITPNPVDLSTGLKIETATDISFGGARGSLELTRSYTTGLAVNGVTGRFGLGTKDNYDLRLPDPTISFKEGGAGRFVKPEGGIGRLFSYAGHSSDGAFEFKSTASVGQLGDVVRKLSAGNLEYRYADGRVARFDSNGRLAAMVDRNGNTTTLSYTGANLTSITDAVGRSITLEYDSANRVTRATDPLGRKWQYAYDGAGRLSTVTDPLLLVVQYAYDGFGRLVSITDPRGNLVKQITYDGVTGRVSEQTFANGEIEHYEYTLSGRTVTAAVKTDSLGRIETKRFNPIGYVIEDKDAAGQNTKIERSLMTNLRSSTTGPGGQTEEKREFDERGNLTKLTDRLGQVEGNDYEPVFNHVTRSVDKLGRSTFYSYDSRGNLTSITNALNQTTTFTYDSFGELTNVTDPLGHTSRLEYDANGNVIARVDALGNRSTMEYDGVGRLKAVIDPLGRHMSLTYDALDRVKTTTDPSGAVTTFTYDENGNLTGLKDALNHTWTSKYDEKNRRISTTDPLGRVMKMQYDLEDQLRAVISPSGRKRQYDYDARGLLTKMTDPLGAVVKYSYDNQKNLVTLIDQRNNTTTFTYDELYRPSGMRDPLGQLSNIGYDAAGNITMMTDRLGRQTTINYDDLNRVSRKIFVDAVVNYAYDDAGRPTRIDDTQAGAIQWTYDDANRLLSETTPLGVVSYAYNVARQRESMTVADRVPVNYGYDSAGRLQTIKQGIETFTFTYDELSRRKSLGRPNGVATDYKYDAVNRLEQLTHTGNLNQLIEDYRYSYTVDDEIESITSLFSAQQLPAAKTVNPADAANRITRFGQSNFTFDAEGQTKSKTDPQGTTNYTWDTRGRLTQATLPNGQTVNYSYDAMGRRTSRAAGGVTTTFLNDGADVVLDRSSDGSAVEYLNGSGIDEKLRQESNIGPIYFIQDHLGSTTALTDLLGNVVERMQYEAFGESAGSAFTRYGYTGRERDADTGLMYYRARWYDPHQGRFLSEDPIAEEGRLSLYAYCEGDPIRCTDPLGLQGTINLFPTNQTIYTNFNSTPLNTNALSIGAHANTNSFYGPGSTPITTGQMVNTITNDPGYSPTTPLYFYSCNAANGTNSPVGRISTILPNPIYGGTNYVWIGTSTNYIAPGTYTNRVNSTGVTNRTLIRSGPATPWTRFN